MRASKNDKRIMLVSSSARFGQGYLEHCAGELVEFLADIRELLFIPYALADHDRYYGIFSEKISAIGLQAKSIHTSVDKRGAIESAEAIFIGGGNTFVLAKTMQELGIMEAIAGRVAAGTPYIGSSAGANISGITIGTTNDMPIVQVESFRALSIVPFNINPHYHEVEPGERRFGETRDERIREFHQYNEQPVVAMFEGAFLRIENGTASVRGEGGVKVFRRGKSEVSVAPGGNISELL